MKQKLVLFALTIFSTMLFSQSVPRAFEDWKTTQGTQNFYYKNVTKTDANGNVIVAGATMSGGTTDILVAKYNASGNLQWIQQYAGTAPNGVDFAAGMYVTDYYVYLTGAVTNNSVTPETDCFTMKLNTTDGTIVWNTVYSGAAGSLDAGKDVIIDGSGNVYVTGASYNASYNSDYLVLKYNSSGVQQWANTWDYTGADDAGYKVAISGANLNISGAVTTATPNIYKGSALKVAQSNGAITAINTLTTVTTTSVDVVCDMVATAGDMYISGSNNVTGQGTNMYVQKINLATFSSSWIYTFNGASNGDDNAKAVAVDASGNVYLGGFTTSGTNRDLLLIKLNSSGVQQWSVTSTFSGDDEIADLILDAGNNIYITGYRVNSKYGDKNYYTAKYTSSGTKVWDTETDGMAYDDNATNIVLDSLNNVIVTGQSSTSPNEYQFLTTKYVQIDTKDPVDLLSQPSNKGYGYYPNRGQIRDDSARSVTSVLYYTHQQNPEVYIEKNVYNYVFAKIDTSATTSDTIERISVSFVGANSISKPYGYKEKTYPLNYFVGHVSEPIVNVVGFDRVISKSIYPNIDLHYYSNGNGFKYYFVLGEGANVKDIELLFEGASSTSITSNKLFIDGVLGDVTLKRPFAYMVDGAGITTTLTGNSNWTSNGGNSYGITVPTYTPSQNLIIVIETDVPAGAPVAATQNLEYSTYYGRTDNDVFNDIRVAANGDRYVVGNTDGGNFPVLKGLFPFMGFRDAVLLQYSVIKDSLVFATFYGGGGDEVGNSVDINSLKEIFIAGKTNGSGSGGITTVAISGASNQTSNGMSIAPSGADPTDGFIARIAPNGNGLTWARYYGGSQEDMIHSIFIDGSDNLYFTGQARSSNITMVNAAQANLSSGSASTNIDAVLGKFNSSLALVYSTYLGGGTSGTTVAKDIGRDITVDGSGNAIVVGSTDAINFPVGNSTGNVNTFYDGSIGGPQDGFIARYSPTGTKQFASFFGAVGAVAIDEITRVNYNSAKDEIYIAGQSNDTTGFPYVVLSGAFNLKRKATNAAFIASMTGNLTKQWCTSYGKAASNFSVTGLSSDNAGIIYLSGQAKSNTLNYPANTPTLTVYQDTVRNADDGFVTIFTPQKDLFHAHYLGGTGNDYINNAYVGANNKLYVVGNTGSTDYPIAYNNINIQFIDSTFGGGSGQNDGFITRFDMGAIQIISVKETSKDDYLLSVYPNPSTSGFVLDMKTEDLKNVQAKVYNITGQVIVEQKITQPQTQFYCESWANGVYLINVNTNGKLKTFKLIKN